MSPDDPQSPIWTEVKAWLPEKPADASIWHQIFDDHGIPGTVEEEDPPTLSGYLAPQDAGQADALIKSLLAAGATKVETKEVAETNWAETWKEFFRPWRIGRRFVVHPTWESFAAEPDDIVLVLDPGQAFGTGDHPTTRLCLGLLEDFPPQDQDVADIGCGTGILAIAAGKLGARRIDAVDVEASAVEAARENAIRNEVPMTVERGLGFDPLPPRRNYDLVLSNILSSALIALAPDASQRIRPGGAWVVSGVIERNWPDVQTAAEANGFRVGEVRQEGDWIAARLLR